MARFELEFKASVEKDVRGIPQQDLAKILERIDALRTDPRPPGAKKLVGSECYRVRQGHYRIIYEIVDQRLIVIAVKIGHRREVYRP